MPTLNDLYWNPGGNQNLNPEQSKSYETGIIIKHKQLQIRLNAYNRTCTNQITWMANSNGLWYAENTNEVEVNGLELIWQLEKKWSEFQFVFRGQHDYCLALNKDQKSTSTFNKQMMYVPKLKHLVQFEMIHGNYKLQYIHQYVGQRFYTSDNSEALPDYQIGNVFLQKQLNLRILKGLAFQFGIMNCWNQQYQNILNRPMPGRQLNLTINYQF
jgi:iron complex outermembrane receptor protein